MWETIRGYLTFTRKERIGVLFLLLIISILFILPYFFRPAVGDPDPAAYDKLKPDLQKFMSRPEDSSREIYHRTPYPDQKPFERYSEAITRDKAISPDMFYFDPNTLNGPGWLRIGLSERLTQTILHYLEKGGRFRKAEDLRKLYGLRISDYERISPYVRIPKQPENATNQAGYFAGITNNKPTGKKADSFQRESPGITVPVTEFSHPRKNYTITDINLADSAGWSQLPGIGEKLASRIVHFREKLGGFCRVEQVGETFGLSDSVFQKIKPSLRLGPVSLIQIDLNKATKETLQAHPYIRWQIAKAIVDYRLQHGGFRTVDELLQLGQMDPGKFEKLKPYLTLGP